ncbi:PaNox3 NADPH oxidase encoded by the PaNox3 protein [Podospora australis]|uniref:PaNox3 NADPH oxidase encoded by the PaNox3 protein n=1 Tax=Podospora australis TaxID=1536484 RepID=A0AAN6WUP1_9PEZI|nr:PaNox3 NADPH oxidase encoded by the PaNox3 protein [Podospora australis]
MANSTTSQSPDSHHEKDSNDSNNSNDVKFLTDEEINKFLDDLDHNNDGLIDYSEVEDKLDKVHAEIIGPKALAHHNLHAHDKDSEGDRDNAARHKFLRSIMRSEKNRIPRQEFFSTVKSWEIPSMQQDQANTDAQDEYMRRLGWPRRIRSYLAVHGPELGFLALVVAMQLAFGIWQLVKYLTGEYYTAGFGWGVVLAKTCAGALYPTFFFLVLSMSRYFATFMRRWYYVSRFINWDVSQSFHIRMSCIALALATLHAIGHLGGSFVWGSRKENEPAVGILLGEDKIPRPYIEYVRSLPGFTGITALGLFWLLAGTSMPPVRRWSYEVFQMGHLLMFPILGLLMAHGTAGLFQWPMFGYWLAFPTLLVLVERTVRVFCGFHGIKATLQILDGETVSIKAKIPSERIWKYRAGQYVFLQVPAISRWQWHPFTVSTCIGNEMQLHIKTDGGWTSSLRKLGKEGGGKTDITIGINGPFGAPAQRFNDFSHSIIVGAGIGVTPFSGILADLQERDDMEHNGPTLDVTFSREDKVMDTMTRGRDQRLETINYAKDYRRVDFHWMVRDKNSLVWLSDLLNRVSHSQHWHKEHDDAANERHLDIRIHTHVTQKRKEIVTHVYRWLLEKHRTPEHPASPLTGLLNKTQFGRPDFVRILDTHYEEMKKFKAATMKGEDDQDEEFKIGVFFCGTPMIGEILADRCRLLSARGREDGSKIEYHFMMEVF